MPPVLGPAETPTSMVPSLPGVPAPGTAVLAVVWTEQVPPIGAPALPVPGFSAHAPSTVNGRSFTVAEVVYAGGPLLWSVIRMVEEPRMAPM